MFGERDVLGKRRRLSAGGKLGLGVHSFRSKLFWRPRTNEKRNPYQK